MRAIREQKDDDEVDAIWAEMAGGQSQPQEEWKREVKSKEKEDEMKDAAAAALQALQAMKKGESKTKVKETV